MASPDELAAIFAAAWSAGAGSCPSPSDTERLANLWSEAKRTNPELDEREFATGLAGLAPGPEGLGAYLGSLHAPELAATLARGTVAAPIGLAGTVASVPEAGGAPAASPRKVPERYRVIRQLGAGAMGVVWEAEDRQLHRKVALKWVTPGAAGDRGYRVRLLREARALAQIHHPNVMAVYDVGESGDELYLALELIDGTTAREAPANLDVWRQAGAGLAAVHAAGIVHRDVKPENVFVARDGRVVIGDFGLATGDLGETMATNLTATGAVVGTPLYMPPEQLLGEPATARGDQFSLCVCAWEALVGKRPFDSTSIAGLAVAMLKPPAIPPAVDRRIIAALLRGLAPEPEDRWPDVPALLAALAPGPAKRRGGLIAIGGALAVGAVGALVLVRLTRSDPAPPPAPPELAVAPAAPDAAIPSPGPAPAPPTAKAPATTKLATGAAPPIAPAVPVASGKPTWREHYDDSISALRDGDGKRCVQLLADVDAWPPDARREADMSRSMLGSCMMAAGDCAGGRAAIQSYGASHGKDAAWIAERVDAKDAEWCPLDAPPESAWPKRVARRIEKHLNNRSSCKVELDFIAAKKLVIKPPIPGNQMMSCLVADHRCDEAREAFYAYARNGGPPISPELKPAIDKNFAAINPTCVDP